MTLNSTFLGVLKRLKKDLSSQAEIQTWLHVYEYHTFEFPMIKQRYILTHDLWNTTAMLYQLSYKQGCALRKISGSPLGS